ncbi:MAG: substrate-binding domain-containing protein [Ardenticatenaceae bacterium]|nr:substrate-binding domain-containing protein [Ardenticatenaceae bacterium]MCB9444162.1 substrate-binding domain-containing protein [Ardenticatenaceae bacterium]
MSLLGLLVCSLLGLLLTGCGQADTAVTQADEMQGTITVSGAWALYPMMVRWSEEFQAVYPNVEFNISAGGAGKGMADALSNAVDIGMVSRTIYPEEEEKGAFWVSVTKDAVFLTINEQNPVAEALHQQGVSRETLVGIFITGEITTWGEVVGQPEMTDPIHVFTRSDAAGAPATWAEYLGQKQEDLLGVGVYGDPGLLDAVIKDPLGIGYNNLNYAFDMDSGLPVAGARVVSLDVNENGRADPEELYDTKDQAVQAVLDGTYPSPPARELNLVTNGQPTGLVKAFLIWVLNDGQAYLEESGYVALSADRVAVELQKLD